MINTIKNDNLRRPDTTQFTKSIGRLVLTGIATLTVGGLTVFDRYNNYWNNTIFRVQTVDFNILSHTLTTKLSYVINQNQPEELQRTLDSNYSLFGLIVTDSSGQKIIAFSGKESHRNSSWKTALNTEELKKYPYDLLLDPPPVFAQWTYRSPRATERKATNLTNRGRVIGRVYYVRGIVPKFADDFLKWLSNPLEASSHFETYTMTLITCLIGGFAFWILLEYVLYKKRVVEEIEQELKDNNKILEVQLAERINELTLLQKQGEQEKDELNKNADNLRIFINNLKQEISQLKESLNSLSTNTDLVILQTELEKTRSEAKHNQQLIEKLNQGLQFAQNKKQEVIQLYKIKENELAQFRNSEKESHKNAIVLQTKLDNQILAQARLDNQIETLQSSLFEVKQRDQYTQAELEKIRSEAERNQQLIEKLNKDLQIAQKEQLETTTIHKIKESELAQLQQQVQDIENSRSLAESELAHLRNSEQKSQVTITRLEKQLANQNLEQQQLNIQLDNLQRSLLESQQREQQLEQLSRQTQSQLEASYEEIDNISTIIGRHPLNRFEVSIKRYLERYFSSEPERVLTQFDVGSGSEVSKCTDFIIIMDNCCIIIEAKSYKGRIESIGSNPRNTGWICCMGSRRQNIYTCWGKNPYLQVDTYATSLRKYINSSLPVYGVIVFPRQAEIDNNIESNIGGFYRVTTLDNLSNVIQELENHDRNQRRLPYQRILQRLGITDISNQQAA